MCAVVAAGLVRGGAWGGPGGGPISGILLYAFRYIFHFSLYTVKYVAVARSRGPPCLCGGDKLLHPPPTHPQQKCRCAYTLPASLYHCGSPRTDWRHKAVVRPRDPRSSTLDLDVRHRAPAWSTLAAWPPAAPASAWHAAPRQGAPQPCIVSHASRVKGRSSPCCFSLPIVVDAPPYAWPGYTGMSSSRVRSRTRESNMADLSESGKSRRPHEPGKIVSPAQSAEGRPPPAGSTAMQIEPPEWPGV